MILFLGRAVDIYLEKHRGLTESEKEQVCEVLDCQKMSQEAIQHAAQNTRLPLRTVVQTLFVGQLHLRDQIASEAYEKMGLTSKLKGHNNNNNNHHYHHVELDENEMKMMNMKVGELEKESFVMKKQIEKCQRNKGSIVLKKKKVSIWNQMKRTFGCSSSNATHEGYARMKKKP